MGLLVTNQKTAKYTNILLLMATQIFLAAVGWAQAISLPEPPQVRAKNHVVSLTLHAVNENGRDAFAFNGTSVAPVIRASPGDVLTITYINDLPAKSRETCAVSPCMDMTNLHFHGLTVSPDAPQDDVLGMLAMPGQVLHYSIEIPRDHPPGLFWYHTHPHGESHRQVLDGMSGAIVIEGMERYAPRIRQLRERVIVVRGRSIEHDPKAAELRRQVEIPSKGCGGEAEAVEEIFTGPEPGTHSALRTLCVDTGPVGDPNPGMVLADVVQPTSDRRNPNHPSSDPAPEQEHAINDRPPVYKPTEVEPLKKTAPDFTVTFTEDKNGFYINGRKFAPDASPMTTVRVGTYQHWRILNQTGELHPFHIHQVHFLAYAENGVPLAHPAWLDTVNVPYGRSVDVILDFTDPVIKGMSVFHCHLLNHEDKGMMAKILFK